MDQLPEDMVAGVFARLAPCWLATARTVCRDWRAAIDTRRLLRTDGLPRTVRGIFVNVRVHAPAEFFTQPSKGHRIYARIQNYVFLMVLTLIL